MKIQSTQQTSTLGLNTPKPNQNSNHPQSEIDPTDTFTFGFSSGSEKRGSPLLDAAFGAVVGAGTRYFGGGNLFGGAATLGVYKGLKDGVNDTLSAKKGQGLADGVVGFGYGLASGAFRGAIVSAAANLMGGSFLAYATAGAAVELAYPMN